MGWLGSLGLLVLILVILKFFFRFPISIVGSLVLTVILSLVIAGVSRARR